MVSLLGSFFLYFFFLQTGSRILKWLSLTWFHYFALTFPFFVLSAHLFSWLCFSLYACITKMVPCLFCSYFYFLCLCQQGVVVFSSLTEIFKTKSVVKRRRKQPQIWFLSRTEFPGWPVGRRVEGQTWILWQCSRFLLNTNCFLHMGHD